MSINFYHQRKRRVADHQVWLALHSAWKRQARQTFNQRLSGVVFVVGVLLSGILFAPDVFFRLLPQPAVPIEAKTEVSPYTGMFVDGTLYSEQELPPVDENLPDGNWLIIPKTGVRTQIIEETEEDHENALKQGVWRVPSLATPLEKNAPVILVAHRYGYLAWSNQYRRQNSFYNLDKLEIGDTFEVIWEKRKFTYEIYSGEEAEEITDYSADVILYTCKFLNSPIRFFRYARRI